jgi:hypothetical protein
MVFHTTLQYSESCQISRHYSQVRNDRASVCRDDSFDPNAGDRSQSRIILLRQDVVLLIVAMADSQSDCYEGSVREEEAPLEASGPGTGF